MEGIMMMNRDKYAVAVRKPNREIEVKVEDHRPLARHAKILQLPIIRGVFSFVDSLVTGMKCLMYSATFYEDEEEEQKRMEMSEEERQAALKKKEKDDSLMMYGSVIFSVVIAVAVFMLLPYFLAEQLERFQIPHVAITIAEGRCACGNLCAVSVAISRMEDIQRVFMYHGAEHKCINCIEHGMELNVENVMKSSREHKRCGTSFLMYVIVISIIFFLFIQVDSPVLRVVYRILLVPVIAGVSYEIIRMAGRFDNKAVNLLSKPGLMLQHLTTREPEPDMVEVAIAAVEAVFDWKSYLKENSQKKTRKKETARADAAPEVKMGEKDRKTLKELLDSGILYLTGKGIEEAATDAWLLLEEVFQISRSWYFAHSDTEAEEQKARRYESLLEQRGQRIPLQHLTGKTWFYGLPFTVNEHVLIPRQDTEILVEEALKRAKSGMKILDMCTGSGCILLSVLPTVLP